MPADTSDSGPTTDVVLDNDSLRAIAHPLRVQLLSELRLHGPATASQLGQQLGQSSGATSYHLRRLAASGFVVEEEARGTRRERWWRAAHRTTRFEMPLDQADSSAAGEYLRAVARSHSDRMLRYADEVETVPEVYGREWGEVFTLSNWTLRLSPERAAQLHAELFELMDRYNADPANEEEVPTLVAQVQLFPVAAAP